MSIFEYDQERHMQQEREAGIEKGRRIGLAEGEEHPVAQAGAEESVQRNEHLRNCGSFG